MNIHNRISKKEKAERQNKINGSVPPYRKSLQLTAIVIALGVALGVAFLMGALMHKRGVINQLKGELGLSNQNLVVLQSIMREPITTLDTLLNASELPTLYIDMKFKHLQKIEAKREEALQTGLLLTSDDDFVPAEIRFQERTVRVKMRLKGDLTDHLDTDKWSFRIHVKGDDQLFGMRQFSIQHPKTRNYLAEWGWLENLRLEGILAPRYRFVNVVFNGTSNGIYALEEHFSKELLESQQRREGVIVTLDETVFWQRWEELGEHPGRDPIYLSGYKSAFVDIRRSSRVASDAILSNERDAAINLLRAFQQGDRPASEVFDASLLGRFLAISELWQATHGLIWHQMNFYYNPVTGKLEPIGFDGDAQQDDLQIGLHVFSHPWLYQALHDPIIAEAYIKELNRISQSKYLEQTDLNEPLTQLQRDLYREFPFVRSAPVWQLLKQRQNYIRRSFDVKNMVLALASNNKEQDSTSSIDTLRIEVRNILGLPVEIVGFQVGDEIIPADMAWAGSEGQIYTRDEQSSVLLLADGKKETDIPVNPTVFHIPVAATKSIQVEDSQSPEITIVTKLLGLSTTHTTPVHLYPSRTIAGPLPSMPTMQQALAKYPFLKQGATDDILIVREGEWDVRGDLVLPQGVRLQAGPGTTLRFAPDAILFSQGPLEFRGAAEAPVVLAPMDSSWGGLVVLDAGMPSVWEHVVVRDTYGIERGGWILTGGITFYQSPIYLTHSRILGSEAEDGINVMRSQFEFRDSEFGGFTSDAFDGDFVEGVIYASGFHDIQGDAIDVSGSQVQVSKVILQNIGDKGISAGERSQVEARDVLAMNTGIAVASKDLSHVELEHATIEYVIHAGLAAYEKKPEYGPASITATDVDFREVSQRMIVQTESWVNLDDEIIKGVELDVEALYAAGILGN